MDGRLYVERPYATESEIDVRVTRASAAQGEWRLVPLSERLAILRRFVTWMEERADALGENGDRLHEPLRLS